jgi:hypothetical protein
MSRIFDFVVVGVIATISAAIHRIGVELFAPNKPLHEIASDGTQVLSGAGRADIWYQMLAIWIPIAVFGAILIWALVREYRRQVTTAVAQRPT